MPLEESINITLSYLKSTGLTDSEKEIPFITDEPKIPTYVCFPSENAAEKYYNGGEYGQGFHPNDKLSRIKSVAECLERLCLFNPLEERFIVSCYNQNSSFIDPALFCCYSEQQLPDRENFLQQLREKKYKWWPAIDITSKEEALLPAQMVFLSNHFSEEILIGRERISTGAALGFVEESHALEAGFFEVIERDACVPAYLTKRKIKRIINFPNDLEKFLTYLERYRLETNVFDVTTDLNIPSVLAVVFDRTGVGPAVNVGTRASYNYHDAIEGAVLESIQCRRGCRIGRKLDEGKRFNDKTNITTIEQRYRYWHSLERIKDIESWLANSDTISYQELSKEDITFEQAIEAIKNKGYHIFVTDITLPELKANKLEVLKVIIPELHPLYIDERAKALYSVHYGTILKDTKLKPHPFS